METIDKPRSTLSGLETVRQRAKQQSRIKFPKSEGESDVRNSLQRIRTLKSKAADAEAAMEDCPADMTMLGRLWDWFQRAIGNR